MTAYKKSLPGGFRPRSPQLVGRCRGLRKPGGPHSHRFGRALLRPARGSVWGPVQDQPRSACLVSMIWIKDQNCWSLTQIILTRHADLGPDPKHWPSEAATAADRSDDCGALLAFGGRDCGRLIGGVWGAEPPKESCSCEPWEPPVALVVINTRH